MASLGYTLNGRKAKTDLGPDFGDLDRIIMTTLNGPFGGLLGEGVLTKRLRLLRAVPKLHDFDFAVVFINVVDKQASVHS